MWNYRGFTFFFCEYAFFLPSFTQQSPKQPSLENFQFLYELKSFHSFVQLQDKPKTVENISKDPDCQNFTDWSKKDSPRLCTHVRCTPCHCSKENPYDKRGVKHAYGNQLYVKT